MIAKDFTKAMYELRSAYKNLNQCITVDVHNGNIDEVQLLLSNYQNSANFLKEQSLTYNQNEELKTFERLKKRANPDFYKNMEKLQQSVQIEQIRTQTEREKQSSTGNATDLLKTTPEDVSSNFFIQILMDWRFQVFCSALLLAGTTGLTLGAFGVGSLPLSMVADASLKTASVLGTAGLLSSAFCYFYTPSTPSNSLQSTTTAEMQFKTV